MQPSLDVFPALTAHLAERGDAVALETETETGTDTLTYRQLARRIAGVAEAVADLPETLGVLAPNGLAFFLADLALSFAGKTFVPLPYFFSPQQLAHIAADSKMGAILTTTAWREKAEAFGLPVHVIDDTAEADFDVAEVKSGGRVIYTSGTTGAPKGVKLGTAQLNASASGLLDASGATADDIYLSVLPYPLLLEQVTGIHVPLIAGARIVLAPEATPAAVQGDPMPLIAAAERAQPTVSVLVPELLRAWVAGLTVSGRKAPETLRFIAVGGAPVPDTLAQAAWNLNIPVFEGYGLSECCSVVAVNRPGARKPGTVGTQLKGLSVAIEDGEIVVTGPTVMDGYLGRDALGDHSWATGDLGTIEADGTLTIVGRKDHVLVFSNGRNVSPEWIEGMVLRDPRFARAILTGHGQPAATLIVTPSPLAGEMTDVDATVAALTAEAPDYAKPRDVLVMTEAELTEKGLLTANGRPKRKDVAALLFNAQSQ